MTRSRWLNCAFFAAGVVLAGVAAWIAAAAGALHADGHLLHDLHATVPAWVTVILGSSVVANVITAFLNVRATKLGRSQSLTDKAFTSYLPFNDQARRYLASMESFTAGRPSPRLLTETYEEAHAHLRRILGANEPPVHLLTGTYNHLFNWPTGPEGLPGHATAHAQDARRQLDNLENAMSELGSRRRRLSSAAGAPA